MSETTYHSDTLHVEVMDVTLSDLAQRPEESLTPVFDVAAGNISGGDLALATNAFVRVRVDYETSTTDAPQPASLIINTERHPIVRHENGGAVEGGLAANTLVSSNLFQPIAKQHPNLDRVLPRGRYSIAQLHAIGLENVAVHWTSVLSHEVFALPGYPTLAPKLLKNGLLTGWVHEGRSNMLAYEDDDVGSYYLHDETPRGQGALLSTVGRAAFNLARAQAADREEVRIVGRHLEVTEAQDADTMKVLDEVLNEYRRDRGLKAPLMRYVVLDARRIDDYVPPEVRQLTQYDLISAHPGGSRLDRRLPVHEAAYERPLGQPLGV